MIPDKLIYTDGHDVIVTDSTLKVKNSQYTLKGITKHGLSIVKPARLPGFILMVLGLLLALAGFLKFIPVTTLPALTINDITIGVNALAIWIGALFVIIGLNLNLMVKKRYAVRIATATGEKDVVISHEKAYIAQIVNALDQAILQDHIATSI